MFLFRLHGDQVNRDGFSGQQAEMACRAAIPQEHQTPWSRQLAWTFAREHRLGWGLPELRRRGEQGGLSDQNTPPTERLRRSPLRWITAPVSLMASSVQPLLPMPSPMPAERDPWPTWKIAELVPPGP